MPSLDWTWTGHAAGINGGGSDRAPPQQPRPTGESRFASSPLLKVKVGQPTARTSGVGVCSYCPALPVRPVLYCTVPASRNIIRALATAREQSHFASFSQHHHHHQEHLPSANTVRRIHSFTYSNPETVYQIPKQPIPTTPSSSSPTIIRIAPLLASPGFAAMATTCLHNERQPRF